MEGVSYNFVDISYQSVIVLYGAVFFLLIMICWIWIAFSRRRDVYLMLCLILTAFNCMIAHHMTEIAYIPFMMLAFTIADAQMELAHEGSTRQRIGPSRAAIPETAPVCLK